MARNITITFDDGSTHVYQGAPDDVTPESVSDRATKEFGKSVVKLDGGRTQVKPVDGPSEGYKAGQAAEGWKQGLMSVAQGPTFGFADEIAGAVSAPFGPGSLKENYLNVRDMFRGAADAQEKENPWTTGITRGMAAAPTVGFGVPVLQGAKVANPGLLMRMAQAGGSGAAFGSLAGLGSSTKNSLQGMAEDTASGGLAGGIFGAAMTPVADVAGAGYKAVASRVSDSEAGRYAKQKVAEAFARDRVIPEVGANSESAASLVKGRLARFAKLGEEATVADAGGQNTRALLDVQATLPGHTKQAVETMIHDRQAGRGVRLRSAAEAGLNPSGLRLTETVDDLVKRRSEAARPLYEKLHEMIVPATPKLQGIVDAAEKLGAGTEARTIATAKQVPYTLSEDGTTTMAVRDLDHLKQGLDDLIGSPKHTDQITGRVDKVGGALQTLKQQLVDELDTATKGAYKSARDAWAGPSALIDAANDGRKFLSLDDQGITKAISNMADSEVEAFRLGAYEALRNKLGKQSGQTEILNMWKEPATQERLKSLFGNEREFRLFASSVAKEGRLKALESVGRGSQTAARQYGAGDLDVSAIGDVAGAAKDITTGNVPSLLGKVGHAWNKVATPEPVRDAIGQILLSKGVQGQREINALAQIMQDVSDARMRNTLGIGVFGSQVNVPNLLSPNK